MPLISKQPDTYLGIDPGKEGGMAVVSNTGQVLLLSPFKMLYETDLEMYQCFCALTKHYTRIVAVLEKVTTSPQMGVVSAGTFMLGYGKLLMALTSVAISFEEVRPQVWQQSLLIPKSTKKLTQAQWKRRLLTKCQQLFPSVPLWKQPKTQGKQLAVCDALLIAEYCRRKNIIQG